MVAVLAYLYAGTVKGAPPPNILALKIASLAMLALIFWFI